MKRYYHLDALRSAAILVVVVWHLTLCWVVLVPMSKLTEIAVEWPLALSRWSLPLFFLMAGFFGAALLVRWGPRTFMKDRLKRIGLPLGVGLVTVVPLSVLAFTAADAAAGRLAGSSEMLHLWFLWYVLLFYGVAAAVVRLDAVDRLRRWADRLMASPIAAPALAVGTVSLMLGGSRLPWPAEPWFVPQPGLVTFYGVFFMVGFLVHGRAGVQALGRRPALNAALACLALVPVVLLRDGPIWLGPGFFADTPKGWLWMAFFCLGAWAGCLAVVGIAERVLTRDRPKLRYLADSTYWIYLGHYPLVPLAVLLLAPLALPFPVAWALSLTLILVPLLVAYELGVRHTPVGRVLNGRRPPRSWRLWPRPGRVPERASG